MGALAVAGVALLVVGLGGIQQPEISLRADQGQVATPPAAVPSSPPPSSSAAAADPPRATVSLDELAEIGRRSAESLPVGITPVRVQVPAIGVDAPLVRLGQRSADEIEVPSTAHEAGWYTPSRRPGEIGPAIIVGHVDLNKGPAVFFRLRDLEVGDEVVVLGEDGDTRTFVVDRLGQYPKTGLPDDVFGFGDARPELRLITCGGVFNRSTGHYEDNIVAYAHLEG